MNISPFAVTANEQLETVKMFRKNNTVATSYILSDLGKLILMALNTLLISTSNLLYRYCTENLKLVGVSLSDFRVTLTELSENEYITMKEFVSCTPSSTGKVYTLAECGKKFIQSVGKLPKMTGYISSLDPSAVKKLLSVQQLAICYGCCPETSIKFAAPVVERNVSDLNNHIFRTQALISSGERTIFLESVRTVDAVSELTEKLIRINCTLKNSQYLNEKIGSEVSVIIVCTDEKVLKAVANAVKKSRKRYCFKISAITDLQVYHGDTEFTSVYTEHRLFKLF